MTAPDPTVASPYDYQTYARDVDKAVSLRPVSLDRDLGRLHAWLGSDHVQPYWDLDLPLPAFRRELEAKLADDHLTPYVGCLDHVPMSYWECYWAAADDLAAHYDADPNDRGVHLLVGPEEYLGEGYAAALLRAVTAMQFRDPDVERVVAEPDVRNDRAHRVFERCGFAAVREFRFEERGKDALLVACERDRFESAVLGDGDPAAPVQGEEVTADD